MTPLAYFQVKTQPHDKQREDLQPSFVSGKVHRQECIQHFGQLLQMSPDDHVPESREPKASCPGVRSSMLNREGDDHRLIPGLWRTEAVMQMMDKIRAPTGEI